MSRQFFDIVRVTRGFYKNQLGVVVDKSSPHIKGIGEPPSETYQVMLRMGSKIVDIEDKDLHIEIVVELEEKKETGEDIENAGEIEPENPEEELDNEKENGEEKK